MDKPKIYKKKSITKFLDPGIYLICTCGLSTTQPYCDGSHQSTAFKPKELKIMAPKEINLCQCKHSKAFPYCDGAHKQL